MSTHAQNLRLALLLAAGLAGPFACGEKEEDDSGNTTGGGGEDGGDDGGGESGGDDGGTELEEVPEGDYPICDGDTSMSTGQCCVDVYCTPAKSDGTCASTDETTAGDITGLSLGSGDCECDAPEGPYAPYDGKDGDCCYLVGVQGCEGRPMIVQGHQRRAPLVRGRSWAA